MKTVLVASCLLFLACASVSNARHMVCYFGSWADYRFGDGNFQVEDIDPHLCTHAIYAFVVLGDEANLHIREARDYDRFTRFANLKKINPGLKTLIAIGGWNDDSSKYSRTFSVASNRVKFAKNAVAFLQKYNFDGLDLDWEYPARRGGAPYDKQSFTELIKTIREEFQSYGYLLTAAVSATEESLVQSYEPANLGKYLDFINIMAYDFHSGWELKLGHNAPLYASNADKGTYMEGYNVDSSIRAWIKNGAPAEKLIMGVGMYGQTFRAHSTSCTIPGCANFGPGWPGPFTRQDGMLGYNEICLMESNPDARIVFDEEAMVPYLSKGVEWVSYDNSQSIQRKIDYILEHNLGGAMIWSIETDDFRGNCGNGRYPLLTQLKNGVSDGDNPGVSSEAPLPSSTTSQELSTGSQEPSTGSQEPSTSSQESSTVASSTVSHSSTPQPTMPTSTTTEISSPSSSPCSAEGYVRDVSECNVFYYCVLRDGKYDYSRFVCSGNLVFDPVAHVCNFPHNVQC